MSFAALSARAQVARLRRTAQEALRQYPLAVARLRLLHHGYNTTFRVDTADGRRFALRVNVNSRRSPAQVRAEMAWLRALAQDTDLRVPTPQATRDGRLMGEVPSPDLGRTLPAALFSWLPGRNLGHEPTPAQAREAGRAMATLHAHAARWVVPEGAALKLIDGPLMDSPNRLPAAHEHLPPGGSAVLDAALSRAQAANTAVLTREPPRALHADLHGHNLKWHRGRLSVFDFDDSALGAPVQDLAIAVFYFRGDPAREEALLAGYRAVSPLPSSSPEEFEALVAGRNLCLLNDLLATTTAGYRELIPRYAANTVTRLRHYLATGTFQHDVPGLIPR